MVSLIALPKQLNRVINKNVTQNENSFVRDYYEHVKSVLDGGIYKTKKNGINFNKQNGVHFLISKMRNTECLVLLEIM